MEQTHPGRGQPGAVGFGGMLLLGEGKSAFWDFCAGGIKGISVSRWIWGGIRLCRGREKSGFGFPVPEVPVRCQEGHGWVWPCHTAGTALSPWSGSLFLGFLFLGSLFPGLLFPKSWCHLHGAGTVTGGNSFVLLVRTPFLQCPFSWGSCSWDFCSRGPGVTSTEPGVTGVGLAVP